MSTTPSIIPPNRVYASSAGIAFDGSDQTTKIQRVFDYYGNLGKSFIFVLDGDAMADTVTLWYKQAIIGQGGAKLTKKPYPGNTSLPLITHKNWVLGSTTVGGTDSYVTVADLVIDGNRRNGANGISGGGASPWQDVNMYQVPVIAFYGVTHARVENVEVIDSPAYAVHAANVTHGFWNNVGHQMWPGDVQGGSAIVQHEGYCFDCHVDGMHGTINDDPWAFNANDGNDATSPISTFRPGTVTNGGGPITDCSVRNCVVGGKPSGGRLLSSNPAAYIRNIWIKDCTYYTMLLPATIDNFNLPLGAGAIDNVTYENQRYEMAFTTSPGWQTFGVAIDNLTMKNCQFVPPASYNAAPFNVVSTSSINSLRADGFELHDSGNNLSGHSFINLAGSINQACFNNTRINRGTLLAQAAVQVTGSTGRLTLIGGWYDHIQNVLAVPSGGAVSAAITSGVSHTSAGTNQAFLLSGSGAGALLTSSASGDIQHHHSSGWGTVKTDGTEINAT